MVEDKVGKKPYLGIVIDYDKEKKLDKFSLDTLISRFENEAIISGNILRQEYKRDPNIYIQKQRPKQTVVGRRDGG